MNKIKLFLDLLDKKIIAPRILQFNYSYLDYHIEFESADSLHQHMTISVWDTYINITIENFQITKLYINYKEVNPKEYNCKDILIYITSNVSVNALKPTQKLMRKNKYRLQMGNYYAMRPDSLRKIQKIEHLKLINDSNINFIKNKKYFSKIYTWDDYDKSSFELHKYLKSLKFG